MKAYFMNQIHELKNEICCLKNQLEDGDKNSDSISVVDFYKSENFFIKGSKSLFKIRIATATNHC